MTALLSDLKIVEATAFIAAPYAGLTLAQMGADVIRIDPIGGGLDYNRWPLTENGRSLYWAGLNKGKRSVTLNVRDPEGQEIAHALMTRSDPGAGIVLSNLPARGWLDFETLKVKRNDLIMVSLSGNRDGSVALDYTVNAAAGFPSITGPIDHNQPVNSVLPAWDLIAGLQAVNGLMAAERHRRDTGDGQFVKLALSDAPFHVLSALGFIGEVQINNAERPKTGNHVYGTFSHDFETKDNRRVVVTAFTPRHWSVLVEAVGIAKEVALLEAANGWDLKDEADRWAGRDEIVALIKPWVNLRTLQDIRETFDEAGVCWGPYQSFSQVVEEDPRVSDNNPMFENVLNPGIGKVLTAGSPIDFSGAERTSPGGAPILGEHTEQVLAEELGLLDPQIGALIEKGIAGVPAT
ncbi:MAG: 2-methylfumaryl-CoA isomerase [Rhodospirillaceae bacterium]|jgi:2-methylfumaryl-CoA isomerase|nr:2-methylfumaryl-CoA isomerase [Rhodospirillales bacterium]MBT3905481.1 2-methylfumaryl-CoA isomerase [Rhodospirillaceae bacterium]MBT4700460.1 2-methylfumaryl-CoA isomerase [Rhodospirillaceae bacterium]MBT5036534.1 2-methylfumaryl-CoA isomerase [Rhodospirillaceae bacterium]MBT6220025.1 2-methylfumaryl-CoA isomerase [Rhodospirillaceae bacterium]